MKKLGIGLNGFGLPADAVTSTLVVYGGKGMGKTNLAAVLCEELAGASHRFSVIDPMGVFWGLRHSKDGKGPGIEVLILGGRHGDFPLEPTGGAVAADLVVDEEANVILDISRRPDGTMWSIAERIRFVTDYCVRLYARQGEKSRPLIQIIDEAGRFVPQVMMKTDGQIAQCCGAIERMVEEGRNVALGVALITQRSARMNKSVSELADCMIAFRTVGPRSVEAIVDWLGEHIPKERWNECVEKLRSLPRGQALVVSPGWLEYEGIVTIRERQTFDSSATPKAGHERRASGAGAKPNLERYAARMAATIEQAKANDPKELKKRIAELERQIKAAPVAKSPAPSAPSKEVLAAAEKRGYMRAVSESRRAWTPLQRAVERACKSMSEAIPAELEWNDLPLTFNPIPLKQFLASPQQEQRREIVKVLQPPNGNGHLGPGERAILIAAAQFENVERDQLSTLTGYKRSSRDTYIQRLREKGYVSLNGNCIAATDEGLAALGDFEPLPTGADLVEYWRRKLTGGELAIFNALVEAGGSFINREVLDEQTGYKRSSRDTYLQRLSARRLVETDRGMVAASKDLL